MKPGPKPKKIICIDTGVIYESVGEAQKQIGSKSLWYNLKYNVPYKGKMYRFYNKSEDPYQTEEEDDEVRWRNFLEAFQNQHPEYNKITKTMYAEEYANYLKSRKERLL